jgi:hypothetical protein
MLDAVIHFTSIAPKPEVGCDAGGEAAGDCYIVSRVISSPPMRRLLRWAFNWAAVLSALLLLATCALWFESRLRSDTLVVWRRTDPPGPLRPECIIHGVEGKMWVVRSVCNHSLAPTARFSVAGNLDEDIWNTAYFGGVEIGIDLGLHGFTSHGFYCVSVKFDDGTQMLVVGIPFWWLAILLSAVPVLWTLRMGVSRIRRKRGHCRSCGYDLRATPDRCPECGGGAEGCRPRCVRFLCRFFSFLCREGSLCKARKPAV